MSDAPNHCPFVIKTFTLTSDFDEDRLRLNACNAAGMTQSMMLTRRLMDRAVPRMAQEAEKLAAGPIPASLTLPIAQQRLRQERQANPVAPVQTPPDAPAWLCNTMQFALRENGVIWVLKGRGGEEARMFLSPTNLRATLDVFAVKYKAMDWTRTMFPEWLTEAEPTASPLARALH